MRFMFAAFIAAMPAFAHAATNGEEDTLIVNRINATDFEVVDKRIMGAQGFWCGAATYIERRSGMSETTRIYVRSPLGPSRTQSGRKGVVFSTSTAGLPAVRASNTVSVSRVGAMLKSAQARRFCRDAFTRSTK